MSWPDRDWSYAEALGRRMLERPELVPPATDPVWRPIIPERGPCDRLVEAWVRGHLRLCRRWGVDRRLGEIPTTFVYAGGRVTIEIGGIRAWSIEVDELIGGAP
jgi:hypothetical protein